VKRRKTGSRSLWPRFQSTFASWDALAAARADPASAGAGEDADAVEGVMLKRRDAPYLPDGRRASGGSGSAIRTSSTPC